MKENEKDTFITIDTKLVEDIKEQLSHNLVGKLLSNRIISPASIKNVMNGAWKTRHKFEIEVAGRNIFAFKFQCQTDREWVLNNGPWLFDKNLIAFEEPTKNQRIYELKFNKTAFWLRLINLPIGLQNKAVAKEIGNKIGEFLEIDQDKEDLF